MIETNHSIEQRFQNILENAHDAFVGINPQGNIIEWNRQAEHLFGWKYSEAVGRNIEILIVPDRFRQNPPRGIPEFILSAEAQGVNKRVQLQAVKLNKEEFFIEMTISSIFNNGSQEFFVFIQDISERMVTEQKLLNMAIKDSLTGLSNRSFFHSQLPEAMARARRNQRSMALMYLDIDLFKSINDSLGHESGDVLLKEFAANLQSCLRETDIVARIGGDEFTVILEGISASEDAAAVASKIIDAVNNGNWLKHSALKITTSIGIAIYDGSEMDSKRLLNLADKAMYKAKHSGRNNFKFLTEKEIEPTTSPMDIHITIENARTLLGVSKTQGPQLLQNTLMAIRRHLGMDVAFISHIHDGIREFNFIDAKDENPPIGVGDSGALEDSYCQRVIDGRLPEIICDAFELPEAMSLPVTVALPVRSHMSVPIRFSNGWLYGTFCCFSYTPDQTLNERDISVMHVFADIISKHLEPITVQKN